MNYRENLISLLEQVKEKGLKNQVAPHILEQNESTEAEIINFRILVPLIGTFNAGKSTLLNTFLQRDVLPTDFLPETAIAAELRYGTHEHIVGFKKNGEMESFELGSIKSITSKDFSHIHVYLRSDALQELNNIVLVDMPGIDSALQEHNNAILSYIRNGVYYVVLTESEYGLKDSVLDFLKELNVYEMDCSILISKSDQKLPSDLESIVKLAAQTAENLAGYTIDVGHVSAKTGNIDFFHHTLASLNQPELLVKHLEPKALEVVDRVYRDLQIRYKHHTLDIAEIEEKIKQFERSLIQLENEVEAESRNIAQTFGYQTVTEIQDDVRLALMDNLETLTRSVKGGEESFKKTLNQILRPVLVHSIESRVSAVLSNSYDKINRKNIEIEELLELSSFEQSEGHYLEKFVDTISNPAFRAMIGGVAILTAIVAPWLEVLLFFAPDIIKLFINQEKRIREHLETNVIPEILEKLQPEVIRSLEDVNQQFMQQLQSDLAKRQIDIKASLEQAKQDKWEAKENDDRFLNNLKESIEELEAIRKQIVEKRNNLVHMG